MLTTGRARNGLKMISSREDAEACSSTIFTVMALISLATRATLDARKCLK